MITLPAAPAPNGATPQLLDFGVEQRPPTGAATARFDRKGSRFAAAVSFPPMEPATSRVFVSRLISAKREGIRLNYPLLEAQGAPGAPVVNGAGQGGLSLSIRGLTAGYQFREGYWLSIVDANGRHYLHTCRSELAASGGGLATIAIEPALRWPFADGAAIHLAAPQIEGRVTSVVSWEIPLHEKVAVQFEIEESA